MGKRSQQQWRWVAKLVSRIFDPFFEMPLILLGVASMAYLNGYRWGFLGLLFVLDALIPGIYFLHQFLVQKRKDWEIHKREMRLPIFKVVVITHGIAVVVAYLLARHPLAEILLAYWLIALAYLVITNWWKISVHTGVNMTLVLSVIMLVNRNDWWLLAIVPLVGWARVIDKDHTVAQALAGAVVPLTILPISMWWWGI